MTRYEARQTLRKHLRGIALALRAERLGKPMEPPYGAATALTASILCAAQSQARGKIHMRWWRKYHGGHEIPTLEAQTAWIEKRLTEIERLEARLGREDFLDAELRGTIRLLIAPRTTATETTVAA